MMNPVEHSAMVETPVYILDSFALLSYLTDEPGAAAIENLFENTQEKAGRLLLSIINLGEILYITERRGGLQRAKDALALLRQLPIEIAPADEQAVFSAAHIKANYPLSYADAFVVALAQQENGAILTGDPEFQSVEELVAVEWLEKNT
jgi:predicted nucleic acid-binding protein